MGYTKNRRCQMNIRISNCEFGWIAGRSRLLGMNMSEYIRHLVQQDILKNGKPRTETETPSPVA